MSACCRVSLRCIAAAAAAQSPSLRHCVGVECYMAVSAAGIQVRAVIGASYVCTISALHAVMSARCHLSNGRASTLVLVARPPLLRAAAQRSCLLAGVH